MPAIFKMSTDDKNTVSMGDSTFVIAESAPAAKVMRPTKKYVIMAVSFIATVSIILTAVLVGMYMFTEAQKEIIKYTLDMGGDAKQDVTSDPNENVVQYHVRSGTQDTWVLNDFSRDIQLMKIVGDGKTNCFITPLNRTNAMDPSEITGPETNEVKGAVSLRYRTSDTPLTDISFLSQTAQTMCSGISVYWLYPQCSDDDNDMSMNQTAPAAASTRVKRQGTVDNSPFYIKTYEYLVYGGAGYWVPCFTGCCRKICACEIAYSAYLSGGRMYCTWITYACPPILYGNYRDQCVNGPRGLVCPNRSPAYPPTC